MALGYTMALPSEDRYRRARRSSRQDRRDARRNASERLSSVTHDGASNDIEKASDLARRMVTEFG